jgi:hypothetical protein
MQQKTIAILGSGDAAVVDNNMPMPPPLALSNIHAQVLAVPNAVFPATAADREICEEAYFEAGLRAAAAGADALYINTVGDYGHAMLRDAVSIPVAFDPRLPDPLPRSGTEDCAGWNIDRASSPPGSPAPGGR